MSQENKFEVEITARIDQLESGLKKAEDSIKKAGSAAASEKGKFSQLGDTLSVMNVNFGGIGVNVGAMVKSFQGASAAIKAATLATRGFGMALAATGIGAIIVALGMLFSAFKSTQQGTDAINKVLAQFKGVMDAIVGLLQGSAIRAFERLKKAFEDPKQAVIDLWEAIKTNLMNRLQGVVDAVVSAAKVMGLALRGNFDGAKLEAKNFANAMAQVATGVENVFDKAGNLIKQVGEAVKNGLDVGGQLADLDKRITLMQRRNTEEIAKQEAIMRKQQGLSRNRDLSLQEQLKHHQAAVTAMDKMQALETELAKLMLERANLATTLNDTSDEEKQILAEKQAALDQINARYSSMGREMQENNLRINRGLKVEQEKVKALEMQKKLSEDIAAIDLAPFENFANENPEIREDMIPEKKLLTAEEIAAHNKDLTGIIQKYHDMQLAADMVSNAVAGIVSNGFDILFDSSKGFEDFAKVLSDSFKRIIADMAAAAAKALVLQAILATFTAGGSQFGNLFRTVLGGQIGGVDSKGIFGNVSGDLLQLAGSRAQNGNSRGGR
jgi:hypothetical protein